MDRTVLISLHNGDAVTIEAAIDAHAATGVILIADTASCGDYTGQAAVLTAAATAVRAFGNVRVVLASPQTIVLGGVTRGHTLGASVESEGAQLVSFDDVATADGSWPVVLIGPSAEAPIRNSAAAPVLRAQWRGWTATVGPAKPPVSSTTPTNICVLAAIAAAAIGISEAFNFLRAKPGSDAGYRTATLNLWNPGTFDDGPTVTYAPAHWWLVGLGHLGQAYCWALSWLDYAQTANVQVVLQDTDRTIPANHSTGLLTPADSSGVFKTRLVADVLATIGYDTRIIERRLDDGLKASAHDAHVALLGVDNRATRRLISTVGWRFAIDVGLGAGPIDFSSIAIRRFPGTTSSTDVTGWIEPLQTSIAVPDTPAFNDLRSRIDACGLTELAGKAVGASFVGAAAATLAVAETVRELHGGHGSDVTTVSLDSLEPESAPANVVGDIVSLPLHGHFS